VPLLYKEEEMKFRRIIIPIAMIVTLLVQFLPGTVFGPRAVAATACDAAEFVADVTIPDGTSFAPGAAMVKTWRFKNVGTCTWSTSYAIVFQSGAKMGAPSAVNMPSSVAPGATVDVTVNMTAPSAPGHYRGNWMLRNASSVLFGVGPSGTWWFFVDIVVSSGSPVLAYDFTTNACAAVWTSGAGALSCPGTDGDARGFLLQVTGPKLETGATGPNGLLTNPQNVTDGYIQGVYPAYSVQSGDHFMSIINCAFGATGCYVTFQLQYQVGSGPINTLKSFKEKLDGMSYNLDVDLSGLAGQNVNFILKVLATGSPTGDRAVWSGPRIAHAGGGPLPPLSSACDKGAFIADVTIPDGTLMTGGTAFVKTWRLMNVGTCTWTTSYRLVFDGGDYMGVTSSAVNLPTPVAPGGTIDLSLNMIAPLSSGTYFSYWRLRNASGVDFGVGPSGTTNFFVKINVASSFSSVYSFKNNAASATWTSGAGALPFPGTDGDARGFVLPLGSHVMEDGTGASEGLLTFPQYVTDGYIQGIYPAFTVQNGDHFQSNVGCQYGGPSNCYVIFRLAYQIGGGPVTTLKTAAERFDGLVYRMDVDLSSLAGQNVNFILRVEAFGSASGDRAVWSSPRIDRSGGGSIPTPIPGATATPVATPTGVIIGPNADLYVTINDSLGSYTPGGTATYTVLVHNSGPNNVTGASLLVTKPVQITSWSVTCVPDSGATCTAGPVSPAGNFTDPVDLPVGKNVVYTIVATLSGGAVGNMVTTATITNPGPTPDPNLANNSASDTDSPPSADLAITINDGISVWVPGGTTTYTVVVSNNGPLNVTGAVFNDSKPIQVTGWSWTCTPDSGAVCGAGSGGTITSTIADTVNIPSGKKVTYTIVAAMTTSVPGNLVNTVTITPPIGTPDPIMSNNTATDTDLGPSADMSVTKSDGLTYYTVGGSLSYTIRVVNNGPQAVINAPFADNMPVQITDWTWSCVPDFSSICAAGPALIVGNFTDTVTIPVGQGVTYTVDASIDPLASGTLVNTASISVPPAFLDLVPGNNTATDIDAAPTADLAITKNDGISIYTPGGTTTYTIVVSNYGPVPVVGALVEDLIPADITSWIWTCVADSGATCTTPPGDPLLGVPSAADFTAHVDIPSGKKITYTVVATNDILASGSITNTVTVTAPVGVVVDPILGNNTAVDTNAHPSADLGVTMSDGVLNYVVGCGSCSTGGKGTYTIVVTNYGPSNVAAATISDTMPLQIASWSWTCTPDLGATCPIATPTASPFSETFSIPAGRSITYTVQYVINAVPPLVLPLTPMTNTVTLTAQTLPYPIPDPNLVNNTATDVDTP
jgi:uncharacterized repeat protein (TIGR01451 family)